MADALKKLIKKNEFPVVFIGSGISRRFLVDFPDWTELLKEFWDASGLENFYGEFNMLRDSIEKNNPSLNEKEIDHFANIKMGTKIETYYNKEFYKEKITIKNFSQSEAFKTRISPFKKAISERFNKYSLINTNSDELISFKKMLLKTQIILTTNYDKFIEDSYNEQSNYQIKKYIGQKGFFQNTFGFAEIYKLHGCADNPMDIIISEKDYETFEQNSVLISAKIISMLLNSPIIFMGYSFTDINVRNIIKDFTKSLNDEEIQILEDRLLLIERKEGEEDFIEEVITDRDLGCKLKVIKTDNFKKVFEQISEINQGIAPTEIRKYQSVIKKLIIDRGKQGTLNSVLLSVEELERLEDDLLTKNITVAIGDAKYIFQIPDIISYCLDYISDTDEINTEIRMRFAVTQISTAPKGRFPMNKILDRELIKSCDLHPSEKEKLIQKIPYFSNFNKHYRTIVSSSVFVRDASDIKQIINMEVKIENIYETLSHNIKNLNLDELKSYLIQELEKLKERGEIKLNTQLRRLLLLYDIEKNKRDSV